jgi:RNA polymerase sigma factor (sigma-70 family)
MPFANPALHDREDSSPCSRSVPTGIYRYVEMNLSVSASSAADLVARARSGDEDAFTRIVDAHHAELVRIAYGVCGDADLARDATQAAWVKVWQGLDMLREPAKLRPWLIAVVSNEARQAARARRRRWVREVAPLDEDRDGDAGSTPQPTNDRSDLIAALERLDPDDRALIVMRYLGGLGSDEIAQAMGRNPSTIRARLSRLMARLREDLADA